MEDQEIVGDESCVNIAREVKLEEDDEVWKETEEVVVKGEAKEDLDEFSVKMFFKGMSIADATDSASGLSRIGVSWRDQLIFLLGVEKT